MKKAAGSILQYAPIPDQTTLNSAYTISIFIGNNLWILAENIIKTTPVIASSALSATKFVARITYNNVISPYFEKQTLLGDKDDYEMIDG